MLIITEGHTFRFDIENLALLFFPRVCVTNANDGRTLTVSLSDAAHAIFEDGTETYTGDAVVNTALYDSERCAVKRAAFTALEKATGLTPPWGLLTGVRPVNFYLKQLSLHGSNAGRIMTEEYLVNERKLRLCEITAKTRESAVNRLTPESYSLYVSVPFCPSRCKYCSFVSYSTEKEKKYVAPYIETLLRQLEDTAVEHNTPDTVYIGGGTPTVLDTELFEELLRKISSCFDLSRCAEYTVEAGRPETITDEKLAVMKKYGVTRVSVNPQTLNPEVLVAAGRKHTTDDFYKAYERAACYGFSVNVDLIAGLPYETAASFTDGIRRIIALSPDNITVHSLYIKRAAEYGMDSALYTASDAGEATKMLYEASALLEEAGYLPYYLYRQKNTVGNNENIGFSKSGREGLYNIYMMDDIQTVYGCGANAMTKLVGDGRITRECGTKFVYNYIMEKNDEIH